MMTDHSTMKLGKLPARSNFGVMRLSRYVRDLPAAPAACNWSAGLRTLGMMMNDQYGDCTIAALGHAVQVWTAWCSANGEFTLPDQEVLDTYMHLTGGQDTGLVIDDVLTWWLSNSLSGHQLSARAAIGVGDQDTITKGIFLLGGVDVGAELPLTAQHQDTWDVEGHGHAARPGSWGGHSMFCSDYNATGPIFITWGERKQATWKWWEHYVSECHGLLSRDWLKDGRTPSGLDWDEVSADLQVMS